MKFLFGVNYTKIYILFHVPTSNLNLHDAGGVALSLDPITAFYTHRAAVFALCAPSNRKSSLVRV